MSDFLITFDTSVSPAGLLRLLRAPYGDTWREGWCWEYPWGAAALLKDHMTKSSNVIEQDGCVGGYVGDSPRGNETVTQLLRELAAGEPACHGAEAAAKNLAQGQGVRRLNGAQAVMITSQRFVCVVTDPMSAVQIYAARSERGEVIVLGTHPDLVAQVAGVASAIDPVSVADFLNTGTPCWPHTMYSHVEELQGGRLFVSETKPDGQRTFAGTPYWNPPDEVTENVRLEDLTREFGSVWRAAVQERCQGERIGVQLSGGLDSRIVMAAVPEEKRCLGLTFCDVLNRETRIARSVAQAYGKRWQALYRDKEYLGRTAVEAIRFTGCEGEWHHAHAIGFKNEIANLGLEEVFTGLYMDNNFKGYYARDIRQVTRCRGLLPAVYCREPLDYVNLVSDFCRSHLTADMQEGIVERRRKFYRQHFVRGRQSEWEWLDGYPLTQACDNTGWIVERRFFPMRLPVNDQKLIDLAFRIPALWKAGGRFFASAALGVLGPGQRVINANDGVRPGSGRLVRLWYRGWRKTRNHGRRVFSRLGVRLPVPHSWHDYQLYWQESPVLENLRREHGDNLQNSYGGVFTVDPKALLFRRDVPWRIGYRLLQLAIWRSILKTYSTQDLTRMKPAPELCAVPKVS